MLQTLAQYVIIAIGPLATAVMILLMLIGGSGATLEAKPPKGR